jgi:DNA-binding response OmpR family regulator
MTGSGEETILVVEDDPDLRGPVQEVLGSAGYCVLLARDGDHALRISQEYSGEIQLLLTDLTLPGANGKETAARIQALRPQMKVLFMSGHGRGVMTEKGTLDLEANYIQKPWSPPGLCEEIRKVLATQPSAQRVLVVDDEEGMRDWLADILEGCGHRVFTAKDGLEAKRLVAQQALDLMITDISMPNEEGLGIIRALRKTQPGLKIIAMSGAYAEALMDAKLLGANAALAKPFTSEMLLKCIRGLSPGPASGVSGRPQSPFPTPDRLQ